MEEPREESEFVGDCSEPMEEAEKRLGLSHKTETLSGEDAITVEASDSGVCDVNGIDVANDGGSTANYVSDEKQVKGEVENMVGSVCGEESKDDMEKTVSSDDVEKTDAIAEPETERNDTKCLGDAWTDEVKPVDEKVGSSGNAVNDEKEKNDFEDRGGACDAEQSVQFEKSQQSLVDGEMLSVAENKVDQEKASTAKSEEDENKMGVDSEQEKEEKVTHSYNGQGDSGCETLDADQEKEVGKKSEEDTNQMDAEKTDAKHSESVIVPEESIQLSEGDMNEVIPGAVSELSSAADIRHEEEITKVNQNEDSGEDMEIDYAAGEQMEKDVKVGGALNNALNESAGADRNDSNVVKEMDIDEQKDSADMATDFTGTIKSTDSADPNSPTEDAATGNIQHLKTETGNVSLKEDKEATCMGEEVSTLDGNVRVESLAAATERPTEGSNAIMGSDENPEVKDHQYGDENTAHQQDKRREENDISHEAPSIDPNQKEDTKMEENPNSDFADDEAGSDIKTNGMKLMEDVLSEDSPGEGRKTVSFAKVSGVQRPSFKIGACIARAASQMAGSPSVVKGSNFGDETLPVESFVLQLHSAAVDPVKENVVSDIATDFFIEFRNSSASQQVTPEKVSSKRIKLSNSNAGGTEAFEFEEMGDTYWTDRVIHNGGEEQTPPTDRGSYQIVPVELKPAQVQRTRRPYRRRQTQISISHSVSEKPENIDKNAPAELIMNFSETDTIPPEKTLSKMFRHFGPIRESQTEVDTEKHRARVVFMKGADAEVAYNSVGKINIFLTKSVKYELSYTITETFKVQPYVVSLGEEDAALCPPS